jgi:hypothetical protein
MGSKQTQIPYRVAQKIRQRAARNETFVVVSRNGKPSRIFGLEEYDRMRQHPLRHKPWTSRAVAKAAAPDPLGAVEGKPAGPLSREEIYED